MIAPAENSDCGLPDQRLLDLLPVGVMLLDEEFTILRWNSTLAKWTSVTTEDALGRDISELFPNVATRKYSERLRQVFTTGLPATYSPAFHKHFLPIPAQHGLEGQLMIQQTEARNYSRDPNVAIVTIQDVSMQYVQLAQLKREQSALVKARDELQTAVQKLEEANKELDDFNYIASHDLQEPLRKIVSFGKLLERTCKDSLDEDGQEFLGFMCDAAERMKRLIGDLLSLSRTSRSELEYADLNLNTCISDVLELLGHRISTTNAEVIIPDLPNVLCDRRLIAQLFQNLIGNALKFIKDKQPCIEITAERGPDHWVLGVKDNGIGIDEKFARRVFQPFHRLHGREEYEGTGIGLSICKKAVTRHAGEIWVESTRGEGSHFLFTLPDEPTADVQEPNNEEGVSCPN